MKQIFQKALLTLALAVIPLGAQADDRPLTVVELYTSQGCHSCPPADKYLGQLKKRDNILALSIHVDYWDYIGWKDPYASPANTQRQRAYAKNLGMGYVYTPQMVIQGMAHTTGSNKGQVERLIRELKGARRLDVKLTEVGNGLKVEIEGGTFDGQARVIVVGFDAEHQTDIRRGENAGKKLSYYNVVRDMAEIGRWKGVPVGFDVPEGVIEMTDRDGFAVLVQSLGSGRILGAAQVIRGPAS